jgi:hypothetical protein
MGRLKFNIVTNCGRKNRTIVRYGDICYIGCSKYTKEEAIEAISEEYGGSDRDAYIAKVEELYSKDITESDVDLSVDGDHAITSASENGYLDVVKYLVEQGTDVATSDNHAITSASYCGHQEVVDYLLSHGASLES